MNISTFEDLIINSSLFNTPPSGVLSTIKSKNKLSNNNRIIFPDDIFSTGDDVIVINHPPVANDRSPHYHDFFELMYMYKGSCKQVINDKALILNEGDICILGMRDSHSVIVENTDNILFNIMIKKSLFDKSFLSLISENDLLSSFFVTSLFNNNKLQHYLYFPYKDNNSIQYITQQLISEYVQKKVCYKKSIECYLALLFSELLREYQSTIDKENYNSMGNNNLSDILSYINTHKATATLVSVAEHFHYSPSYLSTLIKKHTNKSFSDILQQSKLEEACHYLTNTNLSIDEIVQVLGYYDKSYFYKIFKKKYSITPIQYKNNIKLNQKFKSNYIKKN